METLEGLQLDIEKVEVGARAVWTPKNKPYTVKIFGTSGMIIKLLAKILNTIFYWKAYFFILVNKDDAKKQTKRQKRRYDEDTDSNSDIDDSDNEYDTHHSKLKQPKRAKKQSDNLEVQIN